MTLDLDLPHGTLSADLIVTDAGGAEVQRLPLDPDADSLTWAGVRTDGSPLPPGVYGFRTEARGLDGSLSSGVVGVWGTVREVRTGPEGAELVLSGQRVTTPDGITALRRP
jgi:flagellar basal-body rod modification protein FlgD